MKHLRKLSHTALFLVTLLVGSVFIQCLTGTSTPTNADAALAPEASFDAAAADTQSSKEDDSGGDVEPSKGVPGDVCGGQGQQLIPGFDGGTFWGPAAFCDPKPYIEKGRPGTLKSSGEYVDDQFFLWAR